MDYVCILKAADDHANKSYQAIIPYYFVLFILNYLKI